MPMLVTTAEYIREGGGYGNSVDDTVAGILLSPYLIEHLGLRWTGHDFLYADGNGKLAAWDPSAIENGPPALLVDFQQLSELLKSEGMTLVWTILGEKNIHVPTFRERDYKGRLEVFGVAILQDEEVRLVNLTSNFHAPSIGSQLNRRFVTRI